MNTTGPRPAVLCGTLVAVLVLLCVAARAQPAAEALAACAGIGDPLARVACYDGIVRDAESQRAPDDVSVPPAASNAGAERSVSQAPASAPVAATEPPPQEADIEVAIETLEPSGTERRALRRIENEEAGRGFSILVVDRVENISGLSVFVADDGSIFEQVSTRRGRYPVVPFAADLESASRDSYWLRTEAGGRPVRVIERD